MEHAAGAERGENHRQSEVASENVDARVALWRGDRIARPKENVFPSPAVLAQRDFAVGAAVDVVEHGPRNTTLGQFSEIVDIYRALDSHMKKRADRFREPPCLF